MRPEAVVLLDSSGTKRLVRLDQEMLTIPSVGVVRADTLRDSIGRRWTAGDRSFLVLSPSIRDLVGSVRREAQIVTSKDAPAIVWNCDLKSGDLVVEAGAGSGALTLSLARAVGPNGRVASYDIRPEFLDHARENVRAAGFEDSVTFNVGDVRTLVGERDVDAFILDIPDPWLAVRTAAQALRPCGHFASYSPNAEQVNRTVAALRAATFVEIRTLEIIEREIEASASGTHPSFAPLGHTGYLTFARSVLETL